MTTPPRTRSLTCAALRALAPDQGVGVDAVSHAPLCTLCGATTGRTVLGGRRGKRAVGDALWCAVCRLERAQERQGVEATGEEVGR